MFLRNAVVYSGTSFFGQVVSLAQKLVVRRLLPPSAMGVWDFAVVLQSLASALDLGFTSAAAVELPVLDGARAGDAERRVRSTTLVANLALSGVIALCVLVYTLGFLRASGEHLLWSGMTATLIILPAFLSQSLLTFLQGRQRYVALSKASLCNSLVATVMLPLGAYLLGLRGLLVAGVLAAMSQPVVFYTLLRREGLEVDWAWDGATGRRLLSFGLPLQVAEAPQGLLANLDTLVVTRLLGVSALALYTLPRNFFLQVVAIPGMIGSVFVTRSFHLSSARRNPALLAAEVRRFLLAQSLLLHPFLICATVVAYQLLVVQFIPAYRSSIPLIRILPLAIYFLPQTTIVRNFWMLDRKVRAIGLSNVVGLVAIAAAVAGSVALAGLTPTAIAGGDVAGYAIYYLYLMLTIGRRLWGTAGALEIAAHAFVSAAATVLVIDRLPEPAPAPSLAAQLAESGRFVLTAALWLGPLMGYGAWKTAAVRYLRQQVVAAGETADALRP